jgi:PHD/YefM family antitoxin component YafN of YafNO toxin-antitoxin module
MKSVRLADVTGSLSDYAKKGLRETIVVTKRGKPVIAVMPLTAFDDEESLTLSTSPELMRMIEDSRRSAREHGAMSLAEVRQKYGLPKKAPRTRKC